MAKLLTCECVVEDVILLKHPTARVEDAHTSLLPVVDFISSQRRVGVCLDPDPSEGIAVDVVLDQQTLSRIVDQNTAIFPAKNLVSSDDWITTSSRMRNKSYH